MNIDIEQLLEVVVALMHGNTINLAIFCLTIAYLAKTYADVVRLDKSKLK